MIAPVALSLVLFTLGFLPLFGGPRYEAALLSGLVGPSWVACVAASATHRKLVAARLLAQTDGVQRSLSVFLLVRIGSAIAVAHVVAVLAVALLHGLVSGFCEPAEGFLLFLLGPVTGMILAGVVGVGAGAFSGLVRCEPGWLARGLFFTLSLSFPLGSAALRLFEFYSSPTVYAYDSFAGYFAGPLYDTVEYDLIRLLTFRVGTFATLAALFSIALLLSIRITSDGEVRLRLLRGAASRAQVVSRFGLAFAFGLGAVWHGVASEEMGLLGTTEGIKSALGRQTSKGRCVVHFSKGVAAEQAQLVAKECVGHLTQLSSYFETKGPREVNVYLFESAGQKRRLMGAGRTQIAKPWRAEIYIQPRGFPHPVLGHELAHVVSADFGIGPLRVAGALGGLIMDPGRVEGFAEAASPKENSEGTLHEWTAAMKELDLLPPLSSLFQMGFWGGPAARAYSAAGSFVDYARNAHGVNVLKKWYQGVSLPQLTGQSWSEMEANWHAHLEKVNVPAAVLEIARPKFSRPGVFERRCPHAVDRAVREFHAACPFQEATAKRHAARAMALDPAKDELELLLPRCTWASGDVARAQETMEQLVQQTEKYRPEARRAGLDFLGNSRWLAGDRKGALVAYRSAEKLAYRRDVKRQLDVKIWAFGQSEMAREAVRTLLVPKKSDERSPALALAEWERSTSENYVAKYLLARLALRQQRVSEALSYTTSLKEKRLPLESLRREAGRMRVLLSCRRVYRGGERGVLKEALHRYERMNLGAAEKREGRRIVERCLDPGLRK